MIGVVATLAAGPVDPSGCFAGCFERGPAPSTWREALQQIFPPELIHHAGAPPSQAWWVALSLSSPGDGQLECEDWVEFVGIHG